MGDGRTENRMKLFRISCKKARNVALILLLLNISIQTGAAELRPYIIDKSHDIWHAHDPASYIIPDNPVVKETAGKLYIDNYGRIKYKNTPVPLVEDEKGNVLYWTDSSFLNNYLSDDTQFNYPPNGDYWANADYYLIHGMKGDCDEWMITVLSLIRSMELSVIKDGEFVKQEIPAKAVLGYAGGNRDGWVEYKVYNKTFLTTTGLEKDGYGDTIPVTIFIEKNSQFKPLLEFDDKHFGNYKEW